MINFFKKYQLVIAAILVGLLVFTWQSCKTRSAEKEAAKYKAIVEVVQPQLDKYKASEATWLDTDKHNKEALDAANAAADKNSADATKYKKDADKKQAEINKIKDCPQRADALNLQLTLCNKTVDDFNLTCDADKKAINDACTKTIEGKDIHIGELKDSIDNPKSGYLAQITKYSADANYWKNKSKKHWVFGPQGGFGYTPSTGKTDAYIGMGITFKIFEW
jgi:hypothetical protein